MDEEKLKKAADLLKDASDVLLSVRNNSNSNTTSRTSPTIAPGSVAETLLRARSMMQTSSNSGLYRRLNRNERLRAATASTVSAKNKKSKSKPVEKKPFEFALLRANSEESDEEGEIETLRKEKIIERGMIELNEDDDESGVRAKIASSLKGQYSLLGPNDFDFVKVTQKRISVLRLGENTEYNYGVVKKLAGQGLLYIRIKQAFDFVLNEHAELAQDESPPIDQPVSESYQPIQQSISGITYQTAGSTSTITAQRDGHTLPTTATLQTGHTLPTTATFQTAGLISTTTPICQTEGEDNGSEFYDKIISEFPASVIVEPTEMLRYLQRKIVRGRPLDMTDDATILMGDTNFIAVDRDNILDTTFEELKTVQDPRVTFQVDFYGEMAQDSGGPRKEWIRLCNQNIKTKYFDHGLKEHLAEEYFFVGQMAAIALLQNGQAPKYFSEDLLNDIFVSEERELSPCVLKLRQGLDSLGIHMFGRKFPLFLYLLRPSQNNAKLTVPILIHLLKPKFSEQGCNSLVHEKAVYGKFVKYMREVASGRRVVSLENILEFVSGASEEPTLGFEIQPCIEFVVAVVSEAGANYCHTEQNCTGEEVDMKMLNYMRVFMVVRTIGILK